MPKPENVTISLGSVDEAKGYMRGRLDGYKSGYAAAVEALAKEVEGHACDGSDDSCNDVMEGAPCPYDDAARIIREHLKSPGQNIDASGEGGR